jgi:hypothetical protein
MIVDCCTYNGEKDLWDLHYNVLKDVVDEFIVIQFDKTFSGKDRGIHIPDLTKYPKANFLIHHEELYGKYAELAESSPNTVGAAHWKREFMQKESIKDALEYLKVKDDDTVFIGDVDEIWNPRSVVNSDGKPGKLPGRVWKLGLKVYTYWLNNRSSEKFNGTLWTEWGTIKNLCLNHLRGATYPDPVVWFPVEMGWHFTSMGGADNVRKKLTDSYTQESYATDAVLTSLSDNMAQNKDFLGRDFAYRIDESEWPQYLKDNRAKYTHLCK